MAVRDEDEAYEDLRDACDRGDGCPRCMTTVPWLIRKVERGPAPFHCEACGADFHGWADAFREIAKPGVSQATEAAQAELRG